MWTGVWITCGGCRQTHSQKLQIALSHCRDELWKHLQAAYPAEASAYALLAAGGEPGGAAVEAGPGG